MFLSIVIPAFNESEVIGVFLKELEGTIKKCIDINKYEIIVIDDHSSDNTFDMVKKLHKNNIKIIRLSRRSGSHIALRAGISFAKGEAVLCLSADGQDNPNVISTMIQKIKQGYDVIWAVRYSRKEPLIDKIFAATFYRVLNWFTDYKKSGVDLANADFYMLSRKVIDAISSCNERNSSLFGLIIWLGFKQCAVSYERRKRLGGNSKWSFEAKLQLAYNWIIAFSGIPLRLISLFGFFMASSGLIYAGYIFIYAMLGYSKPGWAESVIITLIAGGAQMLILGFVGEYLWRTLEETRRRPLFFIENKTDNV